MLVKRYQGKDMKEVLDTVSRELGPDAVILTNQRVKRKGLRFLFAKPIIEATVGYDPQQTPTARRVSAAKNPYSGLYSLNSDPPAQTQENGLASMSAAAIGQNSAIARYGTPQSPALTQTALRQSEERAKKALDNSTEHMSQLDRRIDAIEQMLADFIGKFRYVKKDVTYDYTEDVNRCFMQLLDQQVEQELAHAIAQNAEGILMHTTGAKAAEAFEHLILEKLGSPNPIVHKKFTQKVILLLGPTGVGKTTSIVKLAASFAVQQKKKVGIINTDTYRIAAQEQLETYADILGIPLGRVYRPEEELAAELEKMADRELIFIDTAGKKPGDEKHKDDVQQILQIARPEDILMCVSATTAFNSLREIFDTYSYIPDYSVLVTKIDETKSRGVLLNICWYARKRLAYITNGQNVPDDILGVVPADIVGELLNKSKGGETDEQASNL
ncbi:MAG: flagellar biosynthesis protein FlhF [Oscillospiraceae bacterium]|jgi:flagellar biosynthesis protein FlhF|nr:flagellar biosynthesis protein FlhF [Oscillospiraceae bacterium]